MRMKIPHSRKKIGTLRPRREVSPLRSLCLCGLFLILIASLTAYTYNHQAGNGGDSDPKTYHFRQNNQNSYLANSSGFAIRNDELLTYLGQTNGFTLALDSLPISDYNWNIAPELSGISNQQWLSTVYPQFDQLRIDTTRARIKSNPELNFKWAVHNGLSLPDAVIDSSHPVLIELNTAKDGGTETVVGMVLFYNGTHYRYMTLELKYDSANVAEQAENTDSFVDIASYTQFIGWKTTGPFDLPNSHNQCTELVSKNDAYATTSKVAFGIYCPHNSDDDAGSAYGFEYEPGFSVFTGESDSNRVLSIKVPKKATLHDIAVHVAVAVKGNTAYFVVVEKDQYVGSNVKMKEAIDGGFTLASFANDLDPTPTASRCFSSSTLGYKTRDAYDPSMDCADDQCYISYIHEQAQTVNCSTAPGGSFNPRVIAFNIASGDIDGGVLAQSKVVPVDDDSSSFKARPRVVALVDGGAKSAAVVYDHIISTNGIPQLKIIPFSGSCWPRQTDNYTPATSCSANKFDVTQVSSTDDDVPVIDAKVKKGQGGDLYIFYTQGDRSLYPTDVNDPDIGLFERQEAPARYVNYRRWRFLNQRSNSPREAILDPIKKIQAENSNLSSFNFNYNFNGMSTLSFIQGNTLYFGKHDGNNFNSHFSKIHKNGSPSASAHTYTSQPKLNVKGPTEGRSIVLWAEGSQLYSRAYYDNIDLQVKYFLQDFGNVLTPSGEKPTTVRNNYSRPGDNRKVEIFVNDQQNDDVITVAIYDRNGKKIRQILLGRPFNSFSQPLYWDKKNEQGSYVSAGVYQVYITSDRGLKIHHPIIIVR